MGRIAASIARREGRVAGRDVKGFVVNEMSASADEIRTSEIVWIPGGKFRMGSEAHHPEESPTRMVSIEGFGLYRFPVTNAQFEVFVQASGYLTVCRGATSRPRVLSRCRPCVVGPWFVGLCAAGISGLSRQSLPMVGVQGGCLLAPSLRKRFGLDGTREAPRRTCRL